MRGRRAATASLRRRPLTVLSPPDPSTENLDLAVFTLLEYSRLAGGLKKIQLCCYVDGEKNVVYGVTKELQIANVTCCGLDLSAWLGPK